VGLDRVRRPVQPFGDGLPVQPADHELQHLLLSVRELEEDLAERLGERAFRRGQYQREQARRKPCPAEHRGADRGHDVLGWPILGHEAHGTGLNRADRRRGVGIGGQDHDRRRRRQSRQRRREVDAADLPELHIHDHGVGLVGRHEAGDLVRVADGRQGLEVRLRAEDSLEPLGKDPVIIDDEQRGRRHEATAGCSRCQPLMSTSPSRTA
jgi:hypothetical protein